VDFKDADFVREVMEWIKSTEKVYPVHKTECTQIGKIAEAYARGMQMIATMEQQHVQLSSKKDKRSSVDYKNIPVDKLDVGKVAKEITRIDMALFKAITPADFVCNLWTKAQYPEGVQRVEDFIEHFNKMSWWTTTKICTCDDVKDRVKLVVKLISIAQELYKLNNFNTSMAIICGLNTSPVLRLKKTWSKIGAKEIKAKEDLEEKFSGEKNYCNYRALEASTKPPLIPFFGLYVQDFTFMNDGNPKKLPSGRINWEKLQQIAGLVLQCMDLQKNAYVFQPDMDINQWVVNLSVMDEKELYNLSLKIEPREEKK